MTTTTCNNVPLISEIINEMISEVVKIVGEEEEEEECHCDCRENWIRRSEIRV